MRIDVVMPKMGESLTEGTIIRWLKQVGEKIERDEMLLEISTDKVDTEVPSPVAGYVAEILATENQTVEVGKVIARIETDATSANTSPAQEKLEVVEPVPMQNTGNLTDVVMPKMGESLTEGTIIRWLKQLGEKIERDEMLLEISTDKVDTEVPSPVAGYVAEILATENQTVEVGKVIARISTTVAQKPAVAAAAQIPQPITSTPVQEAKKVSEQGKRFYSPVVKAIAEEEKISIDELENIPGSGSDGRVTKNDLLKYIENKRTSPRPENQSRVIAIVEPKPIATIPPQQVMVGDDEIIPMDRVRQLIAEHMIQSKLTSAHVTSVAEADVSKIVRFREKYKEQFLATEGFKLTFTPFFAKAVVAAVKAFPMVNVSVDGKNIIRHRRINLGFATTLNDGNLIVPVIKNADALSLSGLARGVYDLSSRARAKKLDPNDIQDGTVTMTNVGNFGTLFGTPVIPQPQTAIFGIGAVQKRPVVRTIEGEDLIVIRDMVYLSITYDHRVIDGMLAGQCLSAFVQAVEAMNEESLTV